MLPFAVVPRDLSDARPVPRSIVTARLKIDPDVEQTRCDLSEIRPRRNGLAAPAPVGSATISRDIDAARVGVIPEDVARYWQEYAQRHKQYDPFAKFEGLGAGIRRVLLGVINQSGDIVKDALGPVCVKSCVPDLHTYNSALRRGRAAYKFQQHLVQQPQALLSTWSECAHVFPTPVIRKIFVDGILAHDGPLDHIFQNLERHPQAYGACYEALVFEHVSRQGANVTLISSSSTSEATPPLPLPASLPILDIEARCRVPVDRDYVAMLEPDFPSFFLESTQIIVFLRVSTWHRAQKASAAGFQIIQRALGDKWKEYQKVFAFVEPERRTAERWARVWHDRMTRPEHPQVRVNLKQPPAWMYECALGSLGIGKDEVAVNVAEPVSGDEISLSW